MSPSVPTPTRCHSSSWAVVDSLLLREPAFVAESLLEDALQAAIGEKAVAKLRSSPSRIGNLTPRELAFGALGAIVSSILATLDTVRDPKERKPHETFDTVSLGASPQVDAPTHRMPARRAARHRQAAREPAARLSL